MNRQCDQKGKDSGKKNHSFYVERPDAFGPKWMFSFNITPVVPNVFAGWLGLK